MINICLNHLESRHQWRAPLFAALLLSLSACGGSGGGGGAASTSGYTVSAIASAGGSIAQPTATVNQGASASFTFTPDVNYSIMSVGGTCGGVLSGNTFTTDAIAADCTVEASFSANILTVNATYGTGGNIGPASVTVDRGATTSFTVTSYLGFTTNMGGSCGGTLNGNIYTTNAINADCTVQASFDLSNYTISTSTSAGGGIDPASTSVNYGNTASFTLTPFTGYEITGVSGTCGGTLVGDIFTTAPITASCSLVANFSLISYIVTTSAGPGGNINPTSIKVTTGNTTSFAVTPNTGYSIGSMGGTCGGSLNGYTYTTTAISVDCTVDASFVINQYTVTPSSGANGSIDLITATVDHGTTTSFTVYPNPNYHASMSGTCGGTLSGNTYTTAAVTADCTVVANFVLNSYTVTASAGANGSINPATASVIHGTTTSFTVTPNANYSIGSVSGCGVGSLSGNTYTTAAIAADCTVVASFVINNYTVTPSAGANGSIDLIPATVDHGATTSFTVTPNAGYTASVAGTCGGTLIGTTYTTTAITADCTVVASFKPPVLSMTMNSVKTFAFSWANVSNATEYRLLENPDGISGYTQVATLGTGVTSHDLVAFLPGRINASYMLEACAGGICAGSNEVFVSGNLATVAGYVKASNTGVGDIFGNSIALSKDGKTLAVGAQWEDSNATLINGNQSNNLAAESGAVYVFRLNGTTWSQQAYIKSVLSSAGDEFGRSVALSADGDTLAVGAPLWDNNIPQFVNSGAAYVYRFNGTNWGNEAYLASGIGEKFGTSLSLSADGNTLAVGSPYYDYLVPGANVTFLDAGIITVFSRSGTNWSSLGRYTSPVPQQSGFFGISVALSADGFTLAAGSHGFLSNAGIVDIFIFSGTGSWSFQAFAKASNAGANDYFGVSVALSADGNTLAVGAHGEDSNATTIDGNAANDLATDSGAAYVFSRSGTSWSQQAYVKASNTGTSDYFGWTVALTDDGNSLAVGAPYEDSNAIGIGGTQANESAFNSGAAYTFARSGTGSWSQQAYVKAPNTATIDQFGAHVMLSGDGSTLAVGANTEDSGATGINNSQTSNTAPDAGAVYLY